MRRLFLHAHHRDDHAAPTAGDLHAGVPASITIVSGDGQSAVPGTVLPIKLAVVVKDGGRAGVAGAVVRFSVDSGGGSLSATSATTDSTGTATGGTWALGSTVMTNVVTVTVGTVTPVRLHAQAIALTATTVFSGAMTGPGGGTLTYQKPGDPLNGLSLPVMPGSYAGPVAWTVVADPTVQVPLPAGFSQVGPSLVITNQQGYADSLMTLTVPMHVPDSMALAPFYYDITSGALEPIPIVNRADSSATLVTRHFNGGLMAVPSNNAAGLRTGASPGFGTFRVMWVQIPVSQLMGTWSSGFTPGVDDWEFPNYGDWLGPKGNCFGMTATAMYYYYYHRSGPNAGPPVRDTSPSPPPVCGELSMASLARCGIGSRATVWAHNERSRTGPTLSDGVCTTG
jgi:hypothetical protein